MSRYVTAVCAVIFSVAGVGAAYGQTASDHTDNRPGLRVMASIALGIDTFGAADIGHYVTDSTSTSNVQVRPVAGIDVAYRPRKSLPIWLDGGVFYSMVSGDYCAQDANCLKETNTPDNVPRAIIQARSFEGYLQPRYEFWRIDKSTDDPPVALYATGRYGLAGARQQKQNESDKPATSDTQPKADTQVLEQPTFFTLYHVGVGARVTDGRYEGSFAEIGWGNSTSFEKPDKPSWSRFKFSARVITDVCAVKGKMFFSVVVDTSPSNSHLEASSYETFMGMAWDFDTWANQQSNPVKNDPCKK